MTLRVMHSSAPQWSHLRHTEDTLEVRRRGDHDECRRTRPRIRRLDQPAMPAPCTAFPATRAACAGRVRSWRHRTASVFRPAGDGAETGWLALLGRPALGADARVGRVDRIAGSSAVGSTSVWAFHVCPTAIVVVCIPGPGW